jgi:ribosomal protein L29
MSTLTDKELELIKANGTKRWNYDAYAKKGVPSKRPNITNIRREIAVIKTELTKRGRR